MPAGITIAAAGHAPSAREPVLGWSMGAEQTYEWIVMIEPAA